MFVVNVFKMFFLNFVKLVKLFLFENVKYESFLLKRNGVLFLLLFIFNLFVNLFLLINLEFLGFILNIFFFLL